MTHTIDSDTPKDTIDRVLLYCEQNAIKLTPLRKTLLLIVAKSGRPITAYELLDELKLVKPKAQAMSVYRVLEFFMTHHLVHRIESLNAFMMCGHLSEKHVSQWLICQSCGAVQEFSLPVFNSGISDIEQQTGFAVHQTIFEMSGLCSNCQ